MGPLMARTLILIEVDSGAWLKDTSIVKVLSCRLMDIHSDELSYGRGSSDDDLRYGYRSMMTICPGWKVKTMGRVVSGA